MRRIKTDDSKKWNEMTLKCVASFLKCDKCKDKYPWYDPKQTRIMGASNKMLTPFVGFSLY